MGLLDNASGYSPLADDWKPHPASDELIGAPASPTRMILRRTGFISVGVLLILPILWKQSRTIDSSRELLGFCDDARALPVRAAKKSESSHQAVLGPYLRTNW